MSRPLAVVSGPRPGEPAARVHLALSPVPENFPLPRSHDTEELLVGLLVLMLPFTMIGFMIVAYGLMAGDPGP